MKAGMKNFIIFFDGKEGTSPLVRLLDNFDGISVVHQVENRGWEPFDRHNCGPMPMGSLFDCLSRVLGPGPIDMAALNAVYTRTATRALAPIGQSSSIGLKMRFRPPIINPLDALSIPVWNQLMSHLFATQHNLPFKKKVIDFLRQHDVFVFIAVRQDVLRWGLSKYHGDGKGRPGHLQFKLASGQISRDEIGNLTVDCDRLAKIIGRCEASHAAKRSLMDDFDAAGIPCAPLRYEEFLQDKPAFFQRLGRSIGNDISPQDVATAIERGAYFEKVHSDDIAEFVQNHEEVLDRFGKRFVTWS